MRPDTACAPRALMKENVVNPSPIPSGHTALQAAWKARQTVRQEERGGSCVDVSEVETMVH